MLSFSRPPPRSRALRASPGRARGLGEELGTAAAEASRGARGGAAPELRCPNRGKPQATADLEKDTELMRFRWSMGQDGRTDGSTIL